MSRFSRIEAIIQRQKSMKLNIVIVETDEMRAKLVIESLQPLGHQVTVIGEVSGLARRVRDIAPDIRPNRHVEPVA